MKKTLKRAPALFLPVVAVAANGITAFAAETGGSSPVDDTAASMISGITGMVSSVSSAIGQVIPHELNIVMAVLIIVNVLLVFWAYQGCPVDAF